MNSCISAVTFSNFSNWVLWSDNASTDWEFSWCSCSILKFIFLFNSNSSCSNWYSLWWMPWVLLWMSVLNFLLIQTLLLYADDTSFIITNPSPIEFAYKLNKICAEVNEWFRNNLLSLNLNKTTYLLFWRKNSQKLDLNITLLNNQITNSTNTKFLGSTNEETLSWNCHINQILLRLSSACYAMKVITPLMSEDTLKIIYYL
jgi:hypothetical protein